MEESAHVVTEQAPQEEPPRGRAVWRLLALVYGVGLMLAAIVGAVTLSSGLEAGVQVRTTRRISTPADVLRPPTGWRRTGDATFQRGAVTGTIERLAVPADAITTPRDRVRYVEDYLRNEIDLVAAKDRGSFDEATPLAGLVGHITQFVYVDSHERLIFRIDHVLSNARIERVWVFRAWYPLEDPTDDEPGRVASRFPDDFTFPGIRLPREDLDPS